MFYEHAKYLCWTHFPEFVYKGELAVTAQLACGAIAGALAQTSINHMTIHDCVSIIITNLIHYTISYWIVVVTYPFDVVRRRMQIRAVSANPSRYRHTFAAFSTIFTEGSANRNPYYINTVFCCICILKRASISYW